MQKKKLQQKASQLDIKVKKIYDNIHINLTKEKIQDIFSKINHTRINCDLII